ncbi:hypothetical protein CEXT_13161 [Caerostris extrusa]|uniref:Uncharacterized protein n=1 Tax=Caerostris extrusa TaxID=172846 RepID=A0AAV4VB49_CAEEX|nr:hypothetical protein CEXT_13161 [Caerostris extrusa]
MDQEPKFNESKGLVWINNQKTWDELETTVFTSRRLNGREMNIVENVQCFIHKSVNRQTSLPHLYASSLMVRSENILITTALHLSAYRKGKSAINSADNLCR